MQNYVKLNCCHFTRNVLNRAHFLSDMYYRTICMTHYNNSNYNDNSV